MKTSDLRASSEAHAWAALYARDAITGLERYPVPEDHRKDFQTEIMDALEAIITYANDMAQQCADQIELQGSGHAVEADAERERMA